MSRDLLARFPELKTLTISRHLDRTVIVEGRFRVPFALMKQNEKEMGVDHDGVSFPIQDYNRPLMALPMIHGRADAAVLKEMAASLLLLEKQVPAFYSQIKFLETDNMRPLVVGLSDDVLIQWGEMTTESVVDRAENILRLRDHFSPKKKLALLRFVTTSRVVMDADWMPVGK